MTRDLPATVDPPAPTPNLPAVAREPLAAGGRALALPATNRKLSAIFSGVQRKGPWVVPETLKVRAVFGGVELDLRNAQLTADVTEIHCRAVFGGIDITVPPNVYVEVIGTAIFGGFDQDDRESTPPPDQPVKVVRISGRAVFGGVSVRVREPGEKDDWARYIPERHRARLERRRERLEQKDRDQT